MYQDYDELNKIEEIDKANSELNEINKAAELVIIYNIINLKKTDDIKQS